MIYVAHSVLGVASNEIIVIYQVAAELDSRLAYPRPRL